MSQAFKCDRCGVLIEGAPSLEYRLHLASSGYNLPDTGDFEVCNACAPAVAGAIMDALEGDGD